MKIASKFGLPLQSCQIIVVSPPSADWDINLLCALYLETGWITTKDSDSKLILVPYIEAYVNAFKIRDMRKKYFQREGKYILLSMQPAEEGHKVIFTTTCFQMQCAKELCALSKKLAFSDFLPVPSVLGSSKSICLSTLNEALWRASMSIITKFRNNYKMQYGVNTEDELSAIDPEWRHENRKIGDILPSAYFSKDQLQGLGEYQIKHFLVDLTQDVDIQQYTKAICDLLQVSLKASRLINGAPDGIRRILLGNGNTGPLHCFLIEKALLQAKLVKTEERFTLNDTDQGVLYRSVKMTRIANALLPPLIQDEEETDGFAFSDREDTKSTLLPLNSFNLQANIDERQIHFILNKVVNASSSAIPVELFTAQERTVEMDHILVTASDIIWDHYQQLESEGHLDALITCYSEHENITLTLDYYKCFAVNLTNFIDNWVKTTNACKKTPIYDSLHIVSKQKHPPV
ncbi:uncharacterized protein ATC70_013191 [Mucor velutinosus]|uniref:Uncharacterized protein n=1 Tax=Mucor velutinosus TaxID=708070 RepID=A0AAN7DT18_9FUNG|nr:hypothetical protein ATC70_013191 [Mucor velutinosus]